MIMAHLCTTAWHVRKLYFLNKRIALNIEKITACLDMHGCPNRCKHCWLGITPNGKLSIDDLKLLCWQGWCFQRNIANNRYFADK